MTDKISWQTETQRERERVEIGDLLCRLEWLSLKWSRWVSERVRE